MGVGPRTAGRRRYRVTRAATGTPSGPADLSDRSFRAGTTDPEWGAGSREVTRWTAQLADAEQERRFREYCLPAQRRTSMLALAAVLLGNLVSFLNTALFGTSRPSASLVWVQVALAVGGCAILGMVLLVRSPAGLQRAAVSALLFLAAAMGMLIATGVRMDFRGAILVVGGVAAVYLLAPLSMVAVTGLAVLYSAVTVTAWLTATPALSTADVGYTMAALAVAHVLSFLVARRAQAERRTLFAQREMLYRLSTADPLTGLANRRAFDARVEQTWSSWRDRGEPLSLLMVDVDNFKAINDGYGHAVGDGCLRAVGGAISAAVHRHCGEQPTRYGGEEFACLLPGVQAAEAERIAVDVLQAVRWVRIPEEGGRPGPAMTVSIGVATAHAGMVSAQDLVDRADSRLYHAKQAGRNRIEALVDRPDHSEPDSRTPGRPGPVLRRGHPASAGMTSFSNSSIDSVV